jgi:hypothetical protein
MMARTAGWQPAGQATTARPGAQRVVESLNFFAYTTNFVNFVNTVF